MCKSRVAIKNCHYYSRLKSPFRVGGGGRTLANISAHNIFHGLHPYINYNLYDLYNLYIYVYVCCALELERIFFINLKPLLNQQIVKSYFEIIKETLNEKHTN